MRKTFGGDLNPDETAVLRRAADLVERGWTRQAWARDADGTGLATDDANAVCWCMMGALARAALEHVDHDQLLAIGMEKQTGARLMRSMGFTEWNQMLVWNDAEGRTPEEVVSVLREAAR